MTDNTTSPAVATHLQVNAHRLDQGTDDRHVTFVAGEPKILLEFARDEDDVIQAELTMAGFTDANIAGVLLSLSVALAAEDTAEGAEIERAKDHVEAELESLSDEPGVRAHMASAIVETLLRAGAQFPVSLIGRG